MDNPPGRSDARPIPVDAALTTGREWLAAWQSRYRVPGLAWIVSDRTETRSVDLLGVASMIDRRPLTPAARWQLGSVSKAFTSMAVLQLQRAGHLTVHDPVIDHLPWASQLRPDLLLHHLMTHTGGLPGGHEWTPDSRLESARQGVVGSPQPPPAEYYYSNPGYELLGDVIEQVTATPIDDYLRDRVLHPMGMTASVAAVAPDDYDRDTVGHGARRDDQLDRGQHDQVPVPWFPTCTSDGAIVATPDDVSHYLRFLLNGGSDAVCPADDFAALTGRHVATGEHEWYGYGLTTSTHRGRVRIGHSGQMIGHTCHVVADTTSGIGSAVLSNGIAPITDANEALLSFLADPPTDLPVIDDLAWPTVPTDDATGPDAWAPMVGLYRSYNPWLPTYRVIRHEGRLLLITPSDGSCIELHRLSETTFGLGSATSPDVASFDVMVDDQFLELEVSGLVLGRVRREYT